MRARIEPAAKLRDLAAVQAGVVSAEQTALLGVSRDCRRRLVREGHWQLLMPGIYLLGVGEPTWQARAWTGILLGGPHARLGFDAAGHEWGLIAEPPELVQVLVPIERQVASRQGWTFPRERPGARSAKSFGTPPRTTAVDTVIDLCDAGDEDAVVDLITKAVQSREVTAADLLEGVRDRPRLRHRRTLLTLLGDVGAGAESVLELRYLHDVERAHGLPVGARQRRNRNGKDVHDVLYEEYATLVELDGALHALRRLRDMSRDNSSLLAGLMTLRYGWPDVTGRPCQVAWQVASLLVAQGWTGVPGRCTRCQNATDADLWFG